MNIIDELKKNKRPLILMNSELQNAMLSMPQKEFICLQDTSSLNDPQWTANVDAEWVVDANLYNVFRLRPDYEDEPEIVECEILPPDDEGLKWVRRTPNHTMDFTSCEMHKDFIGFKFADGTVMGPPVKYSVPGITSHGYYASYEDLKTGQALEHHACHVLFRRKKQE